MFEVLRGFVTPLQREDEVILKAASSVVIQTSRTATHGQQIRMIALQISVSLLRKFNLNERARAITNSVNRTDNRRPSLREAVVVKPALDDSVKELSTCLRGSRKGYFKARVKSSKIGVNFEPCRRGKFVCPKGLVRRGHSMSKRMRVRTDCNVANRVVLTGPAT